MQPFADQTSKKLSGRKMTLAALAVASFSIWYFDLFPDLASVPTGNLETAAPGDGLNEADFIAMLESAAGSELSDTESHSEPQLPSVGDDPLIAALAAQSDPIESAFPEFAQVSGEQVSDSSPSGVQQASFETSTPAAAVRDLSPPVLSPEIAAQLRQVDDWIEQREILEAHASLSRLYWKQPEVRPLIRERLEKTAADIYANPSTHFAEPYMVEFGDTLDSIASRYSVPWQYLARLNRTTPKSLQAGQKLKVLTGPFGAVVDLDDFELTVHAHGWFVRRYRIGIGADGGTPLGEFKVQNKLENPTWYNPDGGVVDADDPANPLGEYWIGLGDHIGIHGTIDPDSIGKAASRGCIHLGDDDIVEIFQLLDVDSPVVIRQ